MIDWECDEYGDNWKNVEWECDKHGDNWKKVDESREKRWTFVDELSVVSRESERKFAVCHRQSVNCVLV
jgi:hypothetical protein